MRLLPSAALLTAYVLLCAENPCNAAEQPSPADERAFLTTTLGCKVGDTVKYTPLLGAASLNMRVTWSGSCIDGRVSGSGVLEIILNDKVLSEYDGEMENGLPNGQGTAHLPGGKTISGVFHDAMIDGHIVLSIEGVVHYEGGWNIDRREGHGVEIFPDGTRFEGEWHNGKREGHGVLTKPDGGSYDGNWRAGVMSGHGITKYPSGSTYEGEYQDGKRSGHGIMSLPSGARIETDWTNDAPGDHASITNQFGAHYDGGFRDWKMDGHGTVVTRDGTRYEGEWRDGHPDGQGTLVRAGAPPFSGVWEKGCFHDGTRTTSFGVPASSCPEADPAAEKH